MHRIAIPLLALVAACAETPSSTAFLTFSEVEPGGEPYPVRMLVTEKFLRIEDGDGQSGYILFDRAARTIYSISHEARTILVLQAQPTKLEKPKKFEHRVERDSATYPEVDGRTVVHYRLITNGDHCLDVYAAEGLLPLAQAALREYHETLASEQAAMQATMPAGLQSACDLADYVFLPARYLAHGFPVRQVNRAGVTRQLTDFQSGVPVEPKLFELPQDYKRIVPADLRKK
jgi:hypothetical protein